MPSPTASRSWIQALVTPPSARATCSTSSPSGRGALLMEYARGARRRAHRPR
jgi:hypothetical protein